jgi:hypothetical protein
MCPTRPVVIPLGTVASTALINPTNFAVGDTTAVPVTVTPKHISVPFSISSAELNNCMRLEKIAAINADAFGRAIWDQINALLKVATFTTNAPVTTSVATWGPNALKEVYGKLKCGPKHVILDPVLFASVMFSTTLGCCFPLSPTDRGAGAYGFASISENSYWTGADAGLLGIGFCPQAIALVSGVPQKPAVCGGLYESRTFTVPGIGLTAEFNIWCDANGRADRASYDIVLGAAEGVDCAMVLIIPGP